MGLRGNNSRSTLVQIHYLVHILEIKPWPPSQSLRSLLSVFIQWENGERNSGSTNLVVPSLGSVIGEGKIEFKESFKLNVTLLRDMSVKGGHADRFKKNFLEIHLYESRREKTAKGQLLATATIDLADYGILEETISVCSPMSCKRSYGNTNQPLLFLQIQPTDNNPNNSSLRCTLSKECSLESNVDEPVSALINEEYAEEAEVVSFADDDISSRSSRAVSSSGFKSNGSLCRQQIRHEKLDENSSFTSSMDLSADGVAPTGADTSDIYHPIADDKCGDISSCTSSVDLHCDLSNPGNGQASIFRSANCTSHHQVSHYNHLSSSAGCDNILEIPNISIRRNDYDFLNQVVYEKFSNGIPINKMKGGVQLGGNHCISNSYSRKEASTVGLQLVVDRPVSLSGYHLGNYGVHVENEGTVEESIEQCETRDTVRNSYVKVNYRSGRSSEMRNLSENKFTDAEVLHDPASIEGRENNCMTSMFVENEKSKHVRSVRSPADSASSRYSLSRPDTAATIKINESIEGTITTKDGRNSILDRKILQLEDKIKMLEGELREAASIEAALYSVVAEHGSSMSKVHAPARRLSRLYLHGHKESFHKRRAGAAKSAISGLVLVAKTCGNDVPRLTFWLSNAVMLRTIICQTTEDAELPVAQLNLQEKDEVNKNADALSLLKWKGSSQNKNRRISFRDLSNLEDYPTFISALEKVESWIFSRIVDSIWWQTLTPYMQPVDQKTHNNCTTATLIQENRRLSNTSDKEQEKFSLDLWKKSFRDAYERLCPIRAGGHECGCLPVLAKLVMEQCVARLDVAMFNAILRESPQDMPTDPISDPVADSMVLPIPTGKPSFGVGAQLKNAIGNWSRWLNYEFGMDDDDSLEEMNDQKEDDERQHPSLKFFFFLDVLSDLLMLPKDMLLCRSIRKEVCPSFGVPLIKRILDNFVPDEFCPDPIPKVVLEALDAEDQFDSDADTFTNFPCPAAPIVYETPSAASIISIMGKFGGQSRLRRNGSSVVSKSNTSDDELDELKSPLASILFDGFRSSTIPTKLSRKINENHRAYPARYELLRDMWMNTD